MLDVDCSVAGVEDVDVFVGIVVVVIAVCAEDTDGVGVVYEGDVVLSVGVDREDTDGATDATDATGAEVEGIRESQFTSCAVTEEFSHAEIVTLY